MLQISYFTELFRPKKLSSRHYSFSEAQLLVVLNINKYRFWFNQILPKPLPGFCFWLCIIRIFTLTFCLLPSLPLFPLLSDRKTLMSISSRWAFYSLLNWEEKKRTESSGTRLWLVWYHEWSSKTVTVPIALIFQTRHQDSSSRCICLFDFDWTCNEMAHQKGSHKVIPQAVLAPKASQAEAGWLQLKGRKLKNYFLKKRHLELNPKFSKGYIVRIIWESHWWKYHA